MALCQVAFLFLLNGAVEYRIRPCKMRALMLFRPLSEGQENRHIRNFSAFFNIRTKYVTAQSKTNDRGGNVFYSLQQNLNRRPQKKIKTKNPCNLTFLKQKYRLQ